MKRCKYILLTLAMLFGIAPSSVVRLQFTVGEMQGQERKLQQVVCRRRLVQPGLLGGNTGRTAPVEALCTEGYAVDVLRTETHLVPRTELRTRHHASAEKCLHRTAHQHQVLGTPIQQFQTLFCGWCSTCHRPGQSQAQGHPHQPLRLLHRGGYGV